MRKLLLTACIILVLSIRAYASVTVFINEIHYDNVGTDAGEAIEIAGPASTNLSGWSMVLYNGANGWVYNTSYLSGVIPNLQNGYGVFSLLYPTNGIQNGSPDGIALVDNSNSVIMFLSYEGAFTAVDGPASGMTTADIGISESSTTPIGSSLQLSGTGSAYSDFTWIGPIANTFGSLNTGQTFVAAPVPEPSTLLLLGFGIFGTSLIKKKRCLRRNKSNPR